MLVGFFVQSHHTHAAGVTSIAIDETYHNVGEEGPGWSFPEAGKLVLTDANLVSISNNKAYTSDTLNIVLEGTNTLQQILYSPSATLTISGSGLLKMTEPEAELNTISSFIRVNQGPLRLKDSAKIDIAYAGNTTDSYRAILVRHLYVDDNASLSVVLTDVHAKTLGIHIFNSFQFNTTGKVFSKVALSSDASEYAKEDTRALLTGNLSSSEAIFAGSGSYEFQVDGGERAVRFENSGTQTFTFNNDQEIVTPVGGRLIVDRDETMIVDADNSPLVPHVKIARKFSLDAVNLGPMGAGTLDVMPDEEIFISGEQATISFTANDGYVIDRARRNGMEIVAARNLVQYTLTETMTEDVTFDVIFKVAPMMYSITLNCGENGTCSKNPDQPRYVAGYEVTVGAVANPGYVIDTFSLNPAATGQSSYYMAVNMTNNWTVDVSFKPAPTYSVAFSVCDSAKGTCIVDPEDTAYTQGSKIDLEVTPKPGFEIDTITINDVPQIITDHQLWTKSTIFVTEDLDLKATFRPEVVVTSLAISSPPTKVHYIEGNQLDLFGLGVLIKRSDNTTEQVTHGDFVAYGITTSLAQGTTLNPTHKNIIITHTASGKTATQAITVVKKDDLVTPPISTPTSTIYRFWSDKLQAHFYTISQDEKEYIERTYPTVWTFEGGAYFAYQQTALNTSPVYRFWSDKLQAHFYTISQDEKEHIERTYPTVWTFEGVAWHANPTQTANTFPVYRFWSNDKQVHFYTISKEEKEHIQRTYSTHIWNYEGIAYYAQR